MLSEFSRRKACAPCRFRRRCQKSPANEPYDTQKKPPDQPSPQPWKSHKLWLCSLLNQDFDVATQSEDVATHVESHEISCHTSCTRSPSSAAWRRLSQARVREEMSDEEE